MKRLHVEGLTLKAALIGGFGLTVGLWVVTGYQFTRRIADVERESSAITARYMQAQELLSSVRAQVLVASVYVRDALLDANPAAAAAYRRQLEDTYAAIDRSLARYVPVLGSDIERDHAARLRGEIDEFRGAMLRLLATEGVRSPQEVRTLLNRDLVPRREAALRVSEEVQALNRTSFVEHQNGIARLHRAAEQQTWQRLGVALVASLGIAAFAILYTGRLESRLRRQLQRDAQNSRYLQWLSERLISAQEEERRTIARELHDEVGQLLTAMHVELCVAQRALNGDAKSARVLEDVQAIAASALHNVRDLSHLLHPAVLDDLGLPAAIGWYLQNFGKRYGLKVELREDGMAKRLAPQLEITAYRVIQEALTNVAKHAHASSCLVVLRRLDDKLEIEIRDDGRGFNREQFAETASPSSGLGLLSMRERVSQLKGTIRFESYTGQGTRVKITLPVSPWEPAVLDDAPPSPAIESVAPETRHA